VTLTSSVDGQVSTTVRIKNHGKGMLNGSVSGPAGAPFSATGTGPFTFSPGNSRRVKVTFSPTSAGTFSTQLTITSDDPDRPAISVPITGTAN
jgi:HYDIN/CFA65/VesB-like, Ig-like domain